jgi:hypothetical protein
VTLSVRLDHDKVVFRDEIERYGPRRPQNGEVAHQAVLDRIAPFEFMRHEYWPVTTQTASSARLSAASCCAVRNPRDLLHEFLPAAASGCFSLLTSDVSDHRPRAAFFNR